MKILIVSAFIFLSLAISSESEAQNCPNDWHPPPCGIPPKPVKSWLQQQLESAEQYHFSASQAFGLALAASCNGSTGDPRVDTVRRTVCTVSKTMLAITVGMQVWESRLISELNALRDGGTQFVLQLPSTEMPMEEVEIDDSNPHVGAILDHADVIEGLGQMIMDSFHATLACDAWAQTDVNGIYCGNDQRAWTETLFKWMGVRYAAASQNMAGLATQMSWDEYADWQFVNDVNIAASENNNIGWGYTQ